MCKGENWKIVFVSIGLEIEILNIQYQNPTKGLMKRKCNVF